MGIFSSKKHRDQPAPPPPVTVSDVDVQKLSSLLDRFSQAVGTDGPLRLAVSQIAQAGGYVDIEDTLRRRGDGQEPWRWINAVARRAAAGNDHFLVGRIFVFLTYWTDVIAPRMAFADVVQIGMGAAPERVQAEAAVLALGALEHMPPDTVLMENKTGAMTVGTMTMVAADRICKLSTKGIPVDDAALLAARQVMGRRH